MANPIKIDVTKLGYELRARVGTVKAAVHTAANMAARRWREKLVDLHDDADKVDTGQHRGSWKIEDTQRSVNVVNDAPYAGIIERGARPHPVSKEGVLTIAKWVQHKFANFDEEACLRIAYGIAAKIKRHGQAGTFIVQNSLPLARRYLNQEVKREIARQAGQPAGPKGRWMRAWGD